ncbi:MAG: hypothetical protein JJU03_07800 [Idiomarina sp.]|nr:hypothetical protein [Idiomarina sp.]
MLKGLPPLKFAGALLCIAIGLNSAKVSAETDLCEYDEAEMLALDPWDFDQHPDKGWRRFETEEACFEVAADLIHTYYQNREMPEGFRRLMIFHEGQFRAEIGQTDAAISLFRQSENPGEDSEVRRHYLAATIAFLEDDLETLKASREKLAAVPKPDNFTPMDADGNEVDVSWPPNLQVVDNLVECFGENYRVWYQGCEVEQGETD